MTGLHRGGDHFPVKKGIVELPAGEDWYQDMIDARLLREVGSPEEIVNNDGGPKASTPATKKAEADAKKKAEAEDLKDDEDPAPKADQSQE